MTYKYVHYYDSLLPHEILEILLFAAIPQKNVNTTARILEDHFGGIGNVFSAPIDELMRIPGIGSYSSQMIKRTDELRKLYAIHDEETPNIILNPENAAKFALENFSGEENSLNFIMLNAEMRVCGIRTIPLDSGERISNVDYKPIMRAVYSTGAAYILLVKNVANQNPPIIQQELDKTDELRNFLYLSEVCLWDSLIIHGGKCSRIGDCLE